MDEQLSIGPAGWTGNGASGGLISRHHLGSNPSPAPNSKAVGERTEGIILGHLMRLGLSVLVPFGNNQRYDLVFDDGKKLWKCQCKTGRLRNGTVICNACSVNGFTGITRGYKGQVDCFLIYCPDNDKIYKVPIDKVGERLISLGIDQRLNPRVRMKPRLWAQDYEI